MTSQKSSLRSEHRAFSPFLYTFSRAFSENFIFPLLNAVFLSVFVVIIPAAYTFSSSQNPEITAILESGKTIGDLYRYVVTIDESIMAYFIILGVCLFSGLTGVFLFRFMAAKKTVNVFYSLGIKRRSLFLAKYAAGTIMMAASIVIPMLVSAFVNIHYLGSSAEMWRAVLYYMLSLYILAMLCMTVTAAVFSAVGTVLEGTFFSAVILLLPTFVIYCLQFLMSKLLWGSPYGQGSFIYGAEYLSVSESLVVSLSHFNPIFFLADGLNRTALMDAGTKPADIMWPSFWELLIWGAVTVVCLGISLLVFQRRKTEICGFLGKNRVLNFVVELTLGFTVATAVLYALYDRIPHILAYVIAIIAYAIVYFGIELLLERSVKTTLKGAWKLPVHLAFPVAVFSIFATGLFGYENRIPELSEIDSVYVDADYNFEFYENRTGPSGSGMGPYGIVEVSQNHGLGGALTTERDKEFAVQLHQMMIDAETADNTQILHKPTAIVYRLKNGNTIRRYYPHTTLEECQESLKLYETDWSREYMEKMISANPKKPPENANIVLTPREDYLRYGYESGEVRIGNGGEFVPLTLTQDQHTALKQALIADITVETAQDHFFPETVLGYLKFDDPSKDESYFQHPAGLYPITDKMTHTRALLEQNGWMSLIPAFPEPSALYVIEAYEAPSSEFEFGLAYSARSFCSYPADPMSTDFEPQDFNGNPAKSLSPDLLDDVRNHLFATYYTGNSGYIITFRFPAYTYSCYLPEKYATSEIKALFKA